ncbi:MAG: carboxylesterase family protein, partial [Pseudomonadales bacterium]|nr:carboxylesterase family protein [Pseudomonadales bacterium]
DGGRPIDPREGDKAVARLMLGYWTNFAKTGNPNGDGLPVWPRYDTETDLALEISAEPGTIGGLRKAKLDLFDRRAAATR